MLVGPAAFRRLCRARERLGAIGDVSPTIEQVAREAAISPFHFIRQFEALFGLTPHQFRTRQRLERAKVLLAAGHQSVTEVCLEVGFSSLGSFSELFRRRVGVPPSAYRRQLVPGFTPLIPGCLGLMALLPSGAFRSFREA